MDPTFVIAGRLRRDYLLIIPDENQGEGKVSAARPLIDAPGGNLLYTAAGLGAWVPASATELRTGLLARAGEDYPHEWLRAFKKRGWDTRGIKIMTEPLDLRYFQATLPGWVFQHINPVAHFARLGLTFPKSLLGYQPTSASEDDRKSSPATSPRPSDIPQEYLNAHFAHICPLDYLSGNRLTSHFRQANVTNLTLDPSSVYMTSTALDDVRVLVHGLTAFLPSEEELRSLFWGRTDDLWEMAEAVGEFGCEFVIVKRGARGQMLYDVVSKKRWEVPAYPARLIDLTGAGDSFCGGFMAGYQETYDPLRGVLHGSVSASLTIEGSGVFHALESMPGLAQARLSSLASIVRQV